MLRNLSLMLAVILILSVTIVPQSLSQPFDELFDELVTIFHRDRSSDLLPLMLNEVFPQGIAPLPNGSQNQDIADGLHGELKRRIGELIIATQLLSLNENTPSDVVEAALQVEAFVRYYETLIDMAVEGSILLDPPPGDEPVIIRQFVNPLFITWWKPKADGSREIEENTFTAEIPIWGAAVIVKEIRGVKLELVSGPLPINPCWWWRMFRIDWSWGWFYYRLVPAEFIKTISYVNTWNAETGKPEVVKSVEQDVIIDEGVMEFWWFLSGAQGAPPKTTADEDQPEMRSTVKKQAVLWGELKHASF